MSLVCCLSGSDYPGDLISSGWSYSSNLGRKSEIFLGGVGSRSCQGGLFILSRTISLLDWRKVRILGTIPNLGIGKFPIS